MAENKADAPAVQKTMAAAKPNTRAQVLARRLKAVQDAGNMTPKMQRNFDRFSAKVA